MNEEDESALLAFLSGARNALGRPLYDAQYALRLARQRLRLHACVALFCELHLYEVRLLDWFCGSRGTAR